MPAAKRALFLDWGGTLALTENNRTVVDTADHPVLMPNVGATLARERPRFDACFIVSNQARVSKGEISAAEVLRRSAVGHARRGGPGAAFRPCPHAAPDGAGHPPTQP